MKKLMLSVLALAAVVLSANAQSTNMAGGTVGAALLKNISVSNTGAASGLTGEVADGALQFGTIGVGSTGTSTIKITPAVVNCRTVSGDAALYTTGLAASAAAFKVMGQDQAYTVAFGASSIVLTSAGHPNLTVNNFKTNLSGNSTTIAGGVSYFAVGADLLVPSTADAAANYSGTFNVIVQYN